MAFKVGDRVVRIGTSGIVCVGTKGIVKRIFHGRVGVKWEGYGQVSEYDNLFIGDYIDREVSETDTLSAACEAYTAACGAFERAQAELEIAKAAVADARIMVERAL